MKKRNMLKMLCALPLLAIILAACATTPAPTQMVTTTKTMINQAEVSGAREYAPVKLSDSQKGLKRAKALVDEGENEEAIRLLEKAMVDARFAEIKSRSEKTQLAARQLQKDIELLESELSR